MRYHKAATLILAVFILVGLNKTVLLKEGSLTKNSVYVTYCGMPSKDTFSLSSSSSNLVTGEVNVYYPVGVNGVPYKGLVLEIMKVSPFYINLRIMGKEE